MRRAAPLLLILLAACQPQDIFRSQAKPKVQDVSDLTGATLADAVDNCLLTAFIVLAILGYHAFQSRRAPVLGRILGALATAMLGIFIVILEYGFH